VSQHWPKVRKWQGVGSMIESLLGLLQQGPPSSETTLDRQTRNRLRYESLLGDDSPKGASLQSQEDIARSLRLLGDSNIAPRPKEKPSEEKPNLLTRIKFVENELLKNYSPEVAAGIMGNIDVESGFDPNKKQILNDGTIGKGRGLFQMEIGGPMFTAYQQYIKNNNMPNTGGSQINFVMQALKDDSVYDIGSGNRKKLQAAFKTGNVDLITKEFSKRFLRPGKPHLNRRLKSARKFSQQIR